jgi:hypothetical protein
MLTPLAFPPLRLYQLWHERSHESDGVRWLRERIAGLVAFTDNALRFVIKQFSARHSMFPKPVYVLSALFIFCANTLLYGDPITIKGARFDAPPACLLAEGALVCKLDGQQFELSVERAPLSKTDTLTNSYMQRLAVFSNTHETSVSAIKRSTANDTTTPFNAYGSYSALGSAMPGKGSPASPAVHFASILHEGDVWEFMEIVAVRTPAIEMLAKSLRESLVLPAPTPDPVAKTNATASSVSPATTNVAQLIAPESESLTVATFTSALLSLQYPRFLEPVVLENTAESVVVNFKHRTRAAGPHLSITLRAPVDKKSAVVIANEKKSALEATLAPGGGSVDINTLGSISGTGHAIIGAPDAKKGLSGIESLETIFFADTKDAKARRLDIRLNAEQKYMEDTQSVWVLLAKSIVLKK